MVKTILIFISLYFMACVQKGKDYEKEYNDRVILTYALAAAADPQTTCENSLKEAEKCLKNASKSPLPVTNEAGISAVFSNNKYFTYQDHCKNQLASEGYKKFSERAKQCLMQCSSNYWTDKQTKETCTEDFTSQLEGIADGTRVCNIDCFKLTNNDPNK